MKFEEYFGLKAPKKAPVAPQPGPDELAVQILLKRSLRKHPNLRKRILMGPTTIVVEVPDASFVALVAERLPKLIAGSMPAADGDTIGAREQPRVGKSKLIIFRRDGTERHATPKVGNDVIASALAGGSSVVGVAVIPERHLPSDLVRAADHRLVVPPLDPRTLTKVIDETTGYRSNLRLSKDLCRSLSLNELCLAIRQGTQPKECFERLERIVINRTSARADGPRLSDLQGLDEARAWGDALVQDLDSYRRGKLPWSAVDRGILLAGPPGVGKTMFVGALALSCMCPLLPGSLAQWQAAGHLGDLLKSLRRTFDDARKRAPCILFIDEIDSFGDRARFSHDHRDYSIQVVNALLEELDGLQRREGVVVVGATNDPDRLDPAIRRSGRLDLTIWLSPPSIHSLQGIFRYHLGADLASEDLTRVAAAASGATGADVERWVRFARRKARNAERPLTIKDLLTTISAEFSSLSQRERHVIAVHEAGHALAAILERIEIRHVSILSPDGGGATSVSRWSKFATRGEYRRHLRFILAGRAAEELTFGEPSDGAGGSSPDSDIARATSIAIAMESDLGLSEDHGLIWLGSAKNPDGPWSLLREPKFADKISTLLKGLYVEVIANLQNHRRILDEIAQSLLEKGHLGGEELVGLVRARLSSVAGKR